MDGLEKYIPLLSDSWKEKYKMILSGEHLENIGNNIQKFKDRVLDWNVPYFSEEIKINRDESFNTFINILGDSKSDEKVVAKKLENIPFEYWLDVLGQRLTSASIRDESAVPPTKDILIQSCRKLFNNEITTGQRAWEKHVGRTDDLFWGQVKGNNREKQEKVMEKINYIIDHKTWWNVFFHYQHEQVYEIREKEGHGIRWNHDGTQLIGFLEIFLNE